MDSNENLTGYDDIFMEFDKMFDDSEKIISKESESATNSDLYKDYLKEYMIPWFIDYRIIEELTKDKKDLKTKVQKESKLSDIAGVLLVFMFLILTAVGKVMI